MGLLEGLGRKWDELLCRLEQFRKQKHALLTVAVLLGCSGQGRAVCLEVAEANARLLCVAPKQVCSWVLRLGGWEHQLLKSLTFAL